MQDWTPDEHLLASARAGRCRRYADLSGPDRAWLVAGLSRDGVTAERVAELMGCSLRTVRAVKADPATTIAAAMLTEVGAFADELRLLRTELRAATLDRDAAARDAHRLRQALIRVTSSRNPDGVPACPSGHPWTPYNTYTEPGTGKRRCRECHRLRQARHRARKATA